MISRITTTAALAAMIGIPATMAMSQIALAADAAPALVPAAVQQPASAPAAPKSATAAPDSAKSGEAAPDVLPNHEVVLALVAGKKITFEQLMNYIKQDTRLVIKATKVSGRAEVLREMILDRLIEEGMRREDLLPKDRAPNAQEYMQAYQQLTSRYFPKADVMPAEEELYKYYREHPEFFGIPAMVRIGQIQFRLPENADEKAKAATRAKAEEALKRLRAGESFAVLAETLTENPLGKVSQGDMGFLQPDKEPWLQKAIEGLAVGQYSEVLESPVGYEIILVQDKRDAMITPYANVRDNVTGRVRQEQHAKAREEYAWKLAKEVGVSVEKPELKDAIPQTTP